MENLTKEFAEAILIDFWDQVYINPSLYYEVCYCKHCKEGHEFKEEINHKKDCIVLKAKEYLGKE